MNIKLCQVKLIQDRKDNYVDLFIHMNCIFLHLLFVEMKRECTANDLRPTYRHQY